MAAARRSLISTTVAQALAVATRKITRPRSDTAPSGYRSITLNVKGPAPVTSQAAGTRTPAPLPFRHSGGAAGVGQTLSYSRHAGYPPAHAPHETAHTTFTSVASTSGTYPVSRAIRPLPGRSRSSTMTSSSLEDPAASLSIQDCRRRQGHTRSSSSVSSISSTEVESDRQVLATSLPAATSLMSGDASTQGLTAHAHKAFTALPNQTAPRRSPGPHNPIDVGLMWCLYRTLPQLTLSTSPT